MNVIDGANVETARRLHRNEQLRLPRHFAAENQLLLVSAGEIADQRLRAITADRIIVDQFLRERYDLISRQQTPAAERRVAIADEDRVLGHCKIQHETVPVA